MSGSRDLPVPSPLDPRIVNPLEQAGWDRQIATFPNATFFHSAAWARVLYETYGYQPLYLATAEGEGFTGILPLMGVDSWLTGKRGVSLPFTDVVPPLVHDSAAFGSLFARAQELGSQHGWKYVECRGGRELLPSAPASTSFFNHVLDLRREEQALFGSFDESTRRAVRKAEKAGLVVEFSRTLEATKDFYRLLRQTRQRHGVPPQPFRFFSAIQRHVLEPGQGCVALVKHQGAPIAGAIYFHFGRQVIYKFGASNTVFQNLRANNLVMWRAIQDYVRRGFESLDFGRTSLGNEGLRKFKLGWGTREQTIEYVRYDFRSGAYVQARDESAGWHTRVFNRMPTWLAEPIGWLLYPHMG